MTPLLASWFDGISGAAIYDGIAWTVVALFLIVGFIGTFVPVLPGTGLIFAGSLVFYFAMGREASGLAWQGLVFTGLLFGLSVALDWVSGAMGAKWFGSSKWGVVGAIVGVIVGLFFGLPGLIVGPLAGVFLFELLVAKKAMKEAGQSTVGTVVGGLAGLLGRVVLALAMLVWFVVDVFVVN